MPRVLGMGGVFIKSSNPDGLRAWYREMLGVKIESWGGAELPATTGSNVVWSPFAAATKYFEPSTREVMLNFRVDDADGLAAELRAKGAQVLDRRDQTADGTFCYVMDPDGTLLELWSAAVAKPA
jgi:predicted enzyme related to lactoylglutathione lyase